MQATKAKRKKAWSLKLNFAVAGKYGDGTLGCPTPKFHRLSGCTSSSLAVVIVVLSLLDFEFESDDERVEERTVKHVFEGFLNWEFTEIEDEEDVDLVRKRLGL